MSILLTFSFWKMHKFWCFDLLCQGTDQRKPFIDWGITAENRLSLQTDRKFKISFIKSYFEISSFQQFLFRDTSFNLKLDVFLFQKFSFFDLSKPFFPEISSTAFTKFRENANYLVSLEVLLKVEFEISPIQFDSESFSLATFWS